jgi:isocitrate dehydrogenase
LPTDYDKITPPGNAQRIEMKDGKLSVPNTPIIPFVEGDGVGPDIWAAAKLVLDKSVEKAYGGKRSIAWFEVFAGEKAIKKYGESLPEDTFKAVRNHLVAIKGPLTTPVGKGFRSLNVAIRQVLNLYACIRPVRYYKGVPSPVRHPERLDVVLFRENTEDVYAGIEWQAGTPEAIKLATFLADEMQKPVPEGSGIGIKPISKNGSQRLIRRAIKFALERKRESVTMVHKGNIMKFTEGAFRDWGYELAAEEFSDTVVSEKDLWDKFDGKMPAGKVLLKDRIADAMFQQVLLRPSEYSVIATPNLNGDYLSDACAAQVGGLGMAPGANLSDEIAFFEATHGTAPKYTGQDKVNPGSLILSGVMMLEHMGWQEAADMIVRALQETIVSKVVTYDLARQMAGARKVSCSVFAKSIVERMGYEGQVNAL